MFEFLEKTGKVFQIPETPERHLNVWWVLGKKSQIPTIPEKLPKSESKFVKISACK